MSLKPAASKTTTTTICTNMTELRKKYRTDDEAEGGGHAYYFEHFERVMCGLRMRRSETFTFLEIGRDNGESTLFWRDYFAPLATIVSLDITTTPQAEKRLNGQQRIIRVQVRVLIFFLTGKIYILERNYNRIFKII